MPLRDLLKKKDKLAEVSPSVPDEYPTSPITFIRSDTHTEEIISPPDHHFLYADAREKSHLGDSPDNSHDRLSRLTGRSRSGSVASSTSRSSETSTLKDRQRSHKRLSQRLGLRKYDDTSISVPQDLPDISGPQGEQADAWEQRATMLAQENVKNRSRPRTPDVPEIAALEIGEAAAHRPVSSQDTDDNIQKAISLHEAGNLEEATRMFGRLADPNGENNALSQVLYGLALRHGWGCKADPERALTYLSAAASNAASIETVALQSGQKGGGAAKGELVLAIFELANSFRHGWGVKKDPFAAKQYYETAANLGDTDAMNEVGWCYLEGFGCKKDKLTAAKYYRLAEKGGSKILGNTWIWKEKYDPPK